MRPSSVRTLFNRCTLVGAMAMASALSLSAQRPPTGDPSLDRVMSAVESVAALVQNFDRIASSPAHAHDNYAPPDVPRNGSVKAAVIRATAGAATGAAVGALTNKGDKAIVTGAIIGAVAGLVYDRLKVDQERRAEGF